MVESGDPSCMPPPSSSPLMGNIIHYSEGVRSVVCCVAVVELLLNCGPGVDVASCCGKGEDREAGNMMWRYVVGKEKIRICWRYVVGREDEGEGICCG